MGHGPAALHFGRHHTGMCLPFTDPIERVTVREMLLAPV